jgi:hypothetical protein
MSLDLVGPLSPQLDDIFELEGLGQLKLPAFAEDLPPGSPESSSDTAPACTSPPQPLVHQQPPFATNLTSLPPPKSPLLPPDIPEAADAQNLPVEVNLYHKPRGNGGVWQLVEQGNRIRVTKGKGKTLKLEVKAPAYQVVNASLSVVDLSSDNPVESPEGVTLTTMKSPSDFEINLAKICKRLQISVRLHLSNGYDLVRLAHVSRLALRCAPLVTDLSNRGVCHARQRQGAHQGPGSCCRGLEPVGGGLGSRCLR